MSTHREVRTAAPTLRRLRLRALSLGGANAFDYAAQFLLPVVLARCLDTLAFGQYRLLWLAVRTAMALAPLAMPSSLYYFLPRSDGTTKRLYVNQTLVFLAFTGLVSGWAVSSWNPWLPETMGALEEYGAIVPAFVLMWVIASLLDMLPAIEERVKWQAKMTVGLAVLRTVALSLAAILTRELGPVLLVLVAFVVFKIVLLLVYVARHHGLRGPILRGKAFADQVRHAAPFGAAGALYDLRAQADQWVAAAIFSMGLFASFSVAAVIGTFVSLFRKSVNTVFLPSMSRLQATGDLRGMLDLNSRANVMVGALACPLAAFAFVFAEELVTIIYTAAYVDAAPVMRVYVIGLVPLVVELASITLLLRQGLFVVGVNVVAVLFAVPISWFAAQHFGLAGAAAGSVSMIYLDRIVTLRFIARRTGVPFRQLQDWRTLALLILFSALAATLAWGMVSHYLATSGPLVRIAAGGAIMATSYGLSIHVLLGLGRGWLTAARNPGHGG
ncbi:MAG TPA: oligosaccharide flippase family protein [Burkholderiales bacterium]|nr:oligosaccharide flippase family protein [Burkholderiales bacterium]